MKEKELKMAKERYIKTKKMLEMIPELELRLEKLKGDSKVKEYIGLNKILTDVANGEYTEEKIIDLSYGEAALNTEDSNNIFIYMGSYDLAKNKVGYYYPFVEYDLYWDLETKTEFYINYDKRKDFEKENNVIFLRSKFSETSLEELQIIFGKVREEFLNGLVETSQKNAVNSFVKKYGRK